MVGGATFDTIAILGADSETGELFCRSFENNGHSRDYALSVDGNVWRIEGDSERATMTFSEDGRRQDVVWEWKVDGTWLPLCDRVEIRTD